MLFSIHSSSSTVLYGYPNPRQNIVFVYATRIEKEVERKLVDFMGKVDYKIKTLEGSVYKKMAEMEEKINERFKDHIDERLRHHVTCTVVEEAIQKVNDNAMSCADKARVDISDVTIIEPDIEI